jgi:hypothetical protein
MASQKARFANSNNPNRTTLNLTKPNRAEPSQTVSQTASQTTKPQVKLQAKLQAKPQAKPKAKQQAKQPNRKSNFKSNCKPNCKPNRKPSQANLTWPIPAQLNPPQLISAHPCPDMRTVNLQGHS